MTVRRDEWGIPHLWADSVLELAFAQGHNAARDRGEQIERDRLHAEGRTAEVMGPGGLGWDTFARQALVDETARRCFERLDEETRAWCEAYVEGVEAGLTRRQPGGWSPWTPLGIFLVQHILFGAFPAKLWRARVVATLGEDALKLLGGEGQALSGSNAWAVGGGRTASGKPIIAGDPHRILESPGVYQQVHLSCPELDVVGFAFPGVPGIQHFAHAGDVAWAITNAMGDYQDLYVEQLRRGPDGVEARGSEGWYAADSHVEEIAVRGAASVRVDVIVTRQGPVVVGGPGAGEGLSLRTPVFVGRDLGFGAFLPLLRSRSVDDVDRAMDRWVEPVNNVVVADVSGAVRYRVAGRVPRRDEAARLAPVPAWDERHTWFGWVDDLPRTDVPDDGAVVTANERRGPESAAIGSEFAPPYRAERIHELIDDRNGLTVSAAAAVHVDTQLAQAASLRGLLDSVGGLSAGAEALRTAIAAWDGFMDADCAGAAVFAAVRGAFVRLVAGSDALAPLREKSPYPALFDPWLDLTGRIAHQLDRLLAAGSPWGIDLPALAADALEEVAAGGAPATWGATHVWAPGGAPAVALSGDTETVLSTSSVPGVTDAVLRGPVARYVWDLSDRSRSRWIVPLGASGDRSDPHHHDQLELWAGGRLLPVVADPQQLAEEPMPLTLTPLDPVADLDLVHDWVTQDRARFWGMTDHTKAEVGEVYAYLDTLTTHHAYLVRDGGMPIAIFQTYEPAADPLGEFYDVRAGDLGVHLFVAPTDTPVAGFSRDLVARLLAEVFADPSVLRVVVEPDIDNDKSVALLGRAGFVWGSVIDLPHKKARLGFLDRSSYEARGSGDPAST